MKVIYRETIADKIKEVLHTNDKPIEKIILTHAEWDELIKCAPIHSHYDGETLIFGVKVEKEKPLIIDVLMGYATPSLAKHEFENTKRRCHYSGLNEKDMVLQIGNKRIKYAPVVSASDYNKIVGKLYDEIHFGDGVDETSKSVLNLRCLRKYHV